MGVPGSENTRVVREGEERKISPDRGWIVSPMALGFTDKIYRIICQLPSEGEFGLIDQRGRAAVSVPVGRAKGRGEAQGDFTCRAEVARRATHERRAIDHIPLKQKSISCGAGQGVLSGGVDLSHIIKRLAKGLSSKAEGRTDG